uniref:Uncharacterized protein n=1 Tax=Rhizophora mucronata TaxID=61149 RepID=A0A2P2PLX8_RHIMU
MNLYLQDTLGLSCIHFSLHFLIMAYHLSSVPLPNFLSCLYFSCFDDPYFSSFFEVGWVSDIT